MSTDEAIYKSMQMREYRVEREILGESNFVARLFLAPFYSFKSVRIGVQILIAVLFGIFIKMALNCIINWHNFTPDERGYEVQVLCLYALHFYGIFLIIGLVRALNIEKIITETLHYRVEDLETQDKANNTPQEVSESETISKFPITSYRIEKTDKGSFFSFKLDDYTRKFPVTDYSVYQSFADLVIELNDNKPGLIASNEVQEQLKEFAVHLALKRMKKF